MGQVLTHTAQAVLRRIGRLCALCGACTPYSTADAEVVFPEVSVALLGGSPSNYLPNGWCSPIGFLGYVHLSVNPKFLHLAP
jgi:hypothetical protein